MMLQAVAHDVKNMLAELALRIQHSDPQAAALAHGAADKLAQALLLDNPNQLAPHIDAASPAELLTEVVAEYRQLFLHKQLKIDASRAPTLWYYDVHLMRLALANLVHNALTHSRQTVQVNAYEQASHLVIEVRDDGEGISADVLTIDWSTHRPLSHSSHSNSKLGTGIGLLLSHKIVSAHVLHDRHGSLTLQNDAVDGGAVVRLSLP